MDEQKYRFGVGVLVVSSIIIGVILIMFFGAAPNFLARRYQVTINFKSAPGVGPDTPVRKNGVEIGRVKEVVLLPDDRGVNLVLDLDPKNPIREGEICRIGAGSLITGDARVEFVQPSEASLLARFDGRDGQPPDGQLSAAEQEIAAGYLKDSDILKGGEVMPDPYESFFKMQEKFSPTAERLAPTLVAVEQAANQFGALTKDMRTFVGGGEGQFRQIVQKTEQTIDNFNRTLYSIESIFKDERLQTSLATVAERLPKLIEETEGLLRESKETVAAFEGVGLAAEATMKNVAEFTAPLGENGQKIVTDAVRTLNNLDGLLSDLRQVSSRLNNGQGTLNRLLTDDDLYYSIQRTVQNVEQLSQSLKPVVHDVRVFTDKLARDPRQLGLAGALQGRSMGLGSKN